MNLDKEIMSLIDNLGDNFNIMSYVHNNSDKFVPGISTVLYSGPYWSREEPAAAIKALLIGKWIASGENVQIFENRFARMFNDKYGVMVNSGSSANLIMLASLKEINQWIDNVSEIIVSPAGFPTTISTIYQNNLIPVFCDIELKTLNFDLDLLEQKINKNTVAIFLSPVLGNPPNIDKLLDICHTYNLKLILDGCDSLGSKWDGKYLSEFSECTSDSLYVAHTISTGQGGMVTSKNKDIVELARRFATWGRSCRCQSIQNLLPLGVCGERFNNWLSPNYEGLVDHRYLFDLMGWNLLPLDLQGAIGNVQLDKIDEIFEKRKRSYNVVSELFKKYIEDIYIPEKLEKSDPIWFGTPIVVKNKEIKNKLVSFLEKHKIQTRNFFAGNLLLHRGYEKLDDYKKYPNSNKVLDTVFFVGASPSYNQEIFDYIESVLQEFKNE